MSKLILVPTPIGNLEDMSFRAVRVLKEVDLIIAEDTRKSSILLKHYEIQNKLISYHKFNEHKSTEALVQKILSGESAALISDAGTPAISDPGYLLVKECLKNSIPVECLPGANSLLPAIAVSGLPCERFTFEGFLPRKKGRKTRLNELSQEERTMIFFESPFRLVKTLEDFKCFFGEERRASVSREISKIFEENIQGTLRELIIHFTTKNVKGEIVIIIAGKSA